MITHRSTALRAGLVAGALCALLAGCGGGEAPAAAPSSLSTATSAAPAAATSTSPAPAVSSDPAGASGSVTTVAALAAGSPKDLTGTRGGLTWDVTVPAFAGSGAAVAAVNSRVETSVTSTVNASVEQNGGDDTSPHRLEGEGAVTTNDGRTVQVVIPMDDYYEGAAHPTGVVNTVVLVAATGEPVTLDQLFTDQSAALTAFGKEVAAQADAEGVPVTEASGLAPTTDNWAAWQTTGDGMEFWFQDYQLGGHGVRSCTVPWDVVSPHLSPYATALLAPTS